jgi:hypothetical protein
VFLGRQWAIVTWISFLGALWPDAANRRRAARLGALEHPESYYTRSDDDRETTEQNHIREASHSIGVCIANPVREEALERDRIAAGPCGALQGIAISKQRGLILDRQDAPVE